MVRNSQRSPLEILFKARRGRASATRFMFLATAFVCLAAGFSVPGFMGYGSDAIATLLWTLAVTLFLLYAFGAGVDACILQHMRKGRFLAELELTGLTPTHIADGLMKYSVGNVVKFGTWFYLLLVGHTFFFPSCFVVDRDEARYLALLWLPALVVLSVLVSYLSQMNALYRDPVNLFKVRFWPYLAVYLLTCLLSVPISLSIVFAPALVVPTVLLSFLLMSLVCRAFVLKRLRGQDPVRIWKLPGLQPGERNPYLVAWSKNPIVWREAHRSAGRVPWGRLGAMLWFFGWGLAFVILILMTSVAGVEFGCLIFCIQFACVQAARTYYASMQLMLNESKRETLEVLQQTTLTANEMLRGAHEAVNRPRMAETIAVALTVFILLTLGKSTAVLYVLPGLAATLLYMNVLTYLGLGVSSRAKTLHQAYWYGTLVGGTSLAILFAPTIGVVEFARELPIYEGTGMIVVWAVVAVAVLVTGSRYFAFASLKRLGFSS